MKKISMIFFLSLMSMILLAACSESQENSGMDDNGNNDSEMEANEAEEIIQIMTTLFPLEDFANRIGKEHVEVENMVPVGADAHTFEPTANQMIDVAEADLFIYNGASFEGFAESVSDAVESHDVSILTATDGIDLIGYNHSHDHEENGDNHHHENNDHNHNHDENNDHDDHNHNDDENNHHENDNGHGHDHGDEDPHVWLDPIRSIELAENIKDALVELRPEAEAEFTENFEELRSELEELDNSFQAMVEEANQNTIIVSHAGYGYWEERYGINQIGISGLSPTNEPSIQQMQEVIDVMESNNIHYVMFEQSIPTNIAETVREQAGAEQLWLHNLEALTETDIENEEDYFSLMEQNIEILKTALQ